MAVVIQKGITIRLLEERSGAPGSRVFQVEGMPSQLLRHWSSQCQQGRSGDPIFSVHVDGTGRADLPPVQGTLLIEEDRLRFRPLFPLQPGVTYRVELRLAGLNPGVPLEPIRARFRFGTPTQMPGTVVKQVYPTTDRVPENLLKFYIYFSAPMSRGGIYEHIHLLDASGRPVELPFLEIDEELWNPEFTRLTLFIDPGRIKRGVRPLEEIGPALEAGRRYTLKIDRAWRDAHGAPLKRDFRKTFDVAPPDREPPDPKQWRVRAPRAGTRDPLGVRFSEPMDHALVERLVRVADSTRARVAGAARVANRERDWIFVPEAPWRAGEYRIVIGSVVEDLAGNSIGRPFEVDVFDSVQRRIQEQDIELSFTVAPVSKR